MTLFINVIHSLCLLQILFYYSFIIIIIYFKSSVYYYYYFYDIFNCFMDSDFGQLTLLGLGLAQIKIEKKKWPAQPEWPKQDWEILRRCMSRSPYKP